MAGRLRHSRGGRLHRSDSMPALLPLTLQVLENVFDLMVNHTRMLRWHEDAIARYQSEADRLQACRAVVGAESMTDVYIAAATAWEPACPRDFLLLCGLAEVASLGRCLGRLSCTGWMSAARGGRPSRQQRNTAIRTSQACAPRLQLLRARRPAAAGTTRIQQQPQRSRDSRHRDRQKGVDRWRRKTVALHSCPRLARSSRCITGPLLDAVVLHAIMKTASWRRIDSPMTVL